MLCSTSTELLRLIAKGTSNSEITERLVISMATVKKHINTIFAKRHVDSRTQALVRARTWFTVSRVAACRSAADAPLSR
jgi:ATP/maltotriose-dependent transcriptional regulator MalT